MIIDANENSFEVAVCFPCSFTQRHQSVQTSNQQKSHTHTHENSLSSHRKWEEINQVYWSE